MKRGIIILFLLIILTNFSLANQASLSPSDVSVVVDSHAPSIEILSPLNQSYALTILVNYTVIDPTLDSTWYSLDNQPNLTIFGPFELTLTEGGHHLIIYANDSFSRINFSEVSFNINSSLGPYCGNNNCDTNENCSNCPSDCGECSYCGDGNCDSDETCSTCEDDCGECSPDDEEKPPQDNEIIILTRDFTLSPSTLKITSTPGQTQTQKITVENIGETSLNINFEISPTIILFSKLNQENLFLGPGEKKDIGIIFDIPEKTTPNVYTGNILAKSGNLYKALYLSIEIESSEPLFDVLVTIPSEYLTVYPGDIIPAEIEIIDVGNVGIVKTSIEKIIKDFEDKIILEKKQNLSINGKINFTEILNIPKNILPGKYVFYVTVNYENKTAISSQEFEVKTNYPLRILIISIIMGIIIILLIIIYLIKKRKKPKKK
ncbi:MAG: hypothetical protein KKF48_00635 [Nanoarchaeota archaeon]|nr:hypothetical protein [Nanoarchaeota archaeon]MBU1027529.1 hypothetical protein [Nanoarchaeota archaeon]